MKSNELREHREAVAGELSSLRARRTQLLKDRDAVKGELAGIPASDIAALRDSEAFKRAEGISRDLNDVQREIEASEGTQTALLGLMAETVPSEIPSEVQGENLRQTHGIVDARAAVAASEELRDLAKSGMFAPGTRRKFGTVDIGEVADRDLVGAYLSGRVAAGPLPAATPGPIGTFAGGVPVDYRGIVPPMLQPLSLLDLIPTGTTDSNTVDYVQVTGLPLGAAETAELALKPELGFATSDQQAPVRTIAGWIKLARQALADIAGLGTFINTQIPYAVRYRLLQQLVGGDGSGVNLKGIYNTTGVLAPAHTVNFNAADDVLNAVTQILLSGAEPNFVAMHPVDYQTLALTKSTTGNYIYVQPGSSHDQPSPALSPPATLWGLPVVRSWAVPQGTPLVGDSSAMTLLIREGLTVRTSDSDQDDFVRNRVTVLGEMRCAFVVWRPAAIAKVALS